MLLYAYSIYDTKALTYSPPFYAVAHGQAIRTVMDACADPNTNLGRHPADYTLYAVGQFNDANGELLSFKEREHISDVLALVPRRQPDMFNPPSEEVRQVVKDYAANREDK